MLEKKILLAQMEPELVSREIKDFVIEQIVANRATGGVIGLSGGVDSTTTAALAERGFGGYNALTQKERVEQYNAISPEVDLELVGYILPSKTNNPKDKEDGISIANRLGTRYKVQSIEHLVSAYSCIDPGTGQSSFHKGNLMSELRALVLHREAAKEKKTVLGTGNKDEDFGIGYYTLFGDGAVHLSPIANLPKRLVRQLAVYLGFEDISYRIPAAGLEPGQTDFKDLGYDYDVVEVVIEGISQGFKPKELIIHSQLAPLVKEQIAKYESMYGAKKFNNVGDVVYDILRRNKIAEQKAGIIHPPAAPVTLFYS